MMAAGAPPLGERMRKALVNLRALEAHAREGGGPSRVDKQHAAGKLTARERLAKLLDPGSRFLEVGLLVAHDRYDGQAPAAGVVTGVGRVGGRPVVIVANDATVKAGAWWPETIQKILRAQEIAMRNRLPIVYLVDSAGVNLPFQDEIFPGPRGAGRIFYYNSIMRRRLRIPQAAGVMGPCIAGGAYLPALSDVIFMVDKTSFMGLGGANLVKGATGQIVDAETLGGARVHTSVSGVAHHLAANDDECLKHIRGWVVDLPLTAAVAPRGTTTPSKSADGLAAVLPEDHRLPYDMSEIVDRVFDAEARLEFQPDFAPELLCTRAHLAGRTVGLLANRRGFLQSHGEPRVGGIVYTESARKAAYFVETCSRENLPIIYFQDVAGFMVGVEQESEGIIRAGAEMIEAMACADVPRIVLTINHASGAGYYAMAGQGFDPAFSFAWPTARIGVMEGDSAVVAVHGHDIARQRKGATMPKELEERIAKTRADYERWLDAQYAAARGHVDAVIDPADTREVLALALDAACASGPPWRWVPEAL